MCGLVGSLDLLTVADVEHRLDLIGHRGPDGRGVAEFDGAVHGHVRLALLDPDARSAQPFARGGGLLSFNGEIWNWRGLRNALRAAGETFVTESDTEVLAAALDRWGVETTLPRLEGMFAFAWSSPAGHVLVRDRFGKIPLHVHRGPRGWAWASERKGIPGLPASDLPPGALLDLKTGRLARWYDLPEGEPRRRTNSLPGDVAADLADSVAARMVADAPVCCLISGGLDSSLILALTVRHRPDVVAFTAVYDPGSADLAAARRVCGELGVRLIEVRVPELAAADLAAAAVSIELPSKAQVEIAALCLPLARAVRAEGFKACLSGEGADELFGGYGSMCIKGSSASDAEWRSIRGQQLAKMARGNFPRCNKSFMAAGVECRLPFLDRRLVERVMALGKAECPPGKKLLKAAAEGIVPSWVARRPKDTFQGGAGVIAAAEQLLANPARFYRAEVATAYGPSALR